MATDLNPPQRMAVETLSGPLLVLAGAGTGKTRVVTYRVANLIRHGTAPDRILAVTFTNKAAAEMQERIAAQLGHGRRRSKDKAAKKPVTATFHSHCVRVLRRHIRRLGYPEQFAIYDRGDQESIARTVLRDIRVSNEMLRPADLLYFIGNWKTRAVRPPAAVAEAETDKEHLAAMGYRRYQKALKLAGAVDFDDLLLCTEQLFAEFDDVRRQEADLFDHLLIDEYQDTNASQYRIVKALAHDHRNLCVVGDDDQSIYGWRGAEVEHILRFRHDWPDARVVRLEDNYRSTQAILEIANRLIAFNKVRHDKILRAARPGGERPRIEQCKTAEEEAQFVVADIRRLLQRPEFEPRDFAILFRTNEQPRAFETELRRAKMNYVLVGSSSFFDRKEVRDVLAYLRVLVAPDDEVSLRRIINTPPRGLGSKTVDLLTTRAVKHGTPLWRILAQPTIEGLTESGEKSVTRFVELVKRYRYWAKQIAQSGGSPVSSDDSESNASAEPTTLTSLVRRLLSDIHYDAEIRRQYPDPNDQQARWAAVEEVVNALAGYESRTERPTLLGFLDEATLGDREFDNEKEKQLQRNAIVLMTLHSAKGLEFPHVYMVGMEEGLLPHHRSVKTDGSAIDEERRLCYVGITRAQERLTLTLALTRMKWGKPRESIPSRFLFEIMGRADNPHRMRKQAGSK
ncbi:MAG: UvrD-helicase domain-containing protein [Planctomycetales bacterium]|nr:UvrD-helicase domain-containing protein [Planctomycetales bacterium]